MRNIDQNDSDAAPNSGALIMDATVANADIKFPTDIGLLNQCREYLETAIKSLPTFETARHHIEYCTYYPIVH